MPYDSSVPSHIATNSSSNSSVVTVQRASSFGRRPKPSAPQTGSYNNALNSDDSANFSSDLRQRPGTSHSRSNSISGVKEGLGNLDRWSASSTSSKGLTRSRSNSFSRRSFSGAGAFTTTTSPPVTASPKKLRKSRPSTENSPPSQAPLRKPFDSVARPPFLPPIVTLPNLDSSSSALTSSSLTPSTGGILSAAVRSTVPDYFGKAWEESTPRNFSQRGSPSQSRSASTDPNPGPIPVPNARAVPHRKGRIASPPSHSRDQSSGKTSSGSGSHRNSKPPSQKAMLSKALQKANTAVLLDNAQNFEGAMHAYSEACSLLQQVMVRSSGDDDRRKLEAIRNTYTSRISELKKIAPHLRDDGKALPARPESEGFKREILDLLEDEEDPAIIETATVTRIVNDQSYNPEQGRSIPVSQVPMRRESLLPSTMDSLHYSSQNTSDQYIGRSYSKPPMDDRLAESSVNLAPPMESQYMPPPLSPRRPLSPIAYGGSNDTQDGQQYSDLPSSNLSSTFSNQRHERIPSSESMSWLDTIDESGGSTASSVHSRTSSMGMRRKHIRAASGATEAEFDAALDAAVEAAYDDGFEPMDLHGSDQYGYGNSDAVLSNVRRRVELAKERVRQSEREAAIQNARDRERRRILKEPNQGPKSPGDDQDNEGNDSDEEERMLEEMTRGYVMDDFEFGLQSKSALPRESDSSGFSGRTWNSSIGSNPTTAGTNLSTLTEGSVVPKIPTLPSQPPPVQFLPPILSNPAAQPPPIVPPPSQGVRSRRLSGQNAKQLKIETTAKGLSGQAGPLTLPPSMPPPRIPDLEVQPKTAGLVQQRHVPQAMPNRPPIPQSTHQPSSHFPPPSPTEIISPPTPSLTQPFTNDGESNAELPRSGSPGRTQSRAGLRKNFSSSSLKNMRGRNLSVSNIDDGSDVSPNTPISSQFGARDATGRLPAMPALPTPIAVAFKDRMNGVQSGGLYLFNSDIHSPDSPGSPNPLAAGAPIPLEPCPTEFLLRPFWLMRALYQTITHPRGGYLSTKLFVPRDVWRVKGVKIKGIEDKIANCDFLTAALMKLAQVDTFDADAVLEEMQSLEGILEQVQTILSKKLGSEVGVQGSGGMFKDVSNYVESENSTISSKSGSLSSKSSSFSWRRLRSKNSGVGLSNTYSNKTISPDGPKESLTLGTLPMTSLPKTRFAKRNVSQLQFSGPNANYMGALARLFDAAQTIDQIARQVEDPGLRHADKTQVGLELCTRHAAEFFGFYVCRFVLTDIGLLLDKFIKRGSEWVLV
ncbi:hypothetical protein B7494_g2299 [Chlorociboria aeruginascens]|nr:hypothetical protein B7494_g2299 [Chlorociboria aeruginascens]